MATTRSPRNMATDAPVRPQRTQPGDGDPPRRVRRKKRKRNPFWEAIKAFFNTIAIILLLLGLGVIAALMVFISQTPRHVDLTFNPPGVTMIYSSDGTPLAKYFVENRQVVTIDKIPRNLQLATVALEDRRFYEHNGIDMEGIGRAIISNFRHGDMHGEGASTITQQLARNLGIAGLTRKKSFERKIREWLVANQIEHSYSKQQILEMYLNEVNYGSGAYGVEAAAKTYFAKDVSELDLAECALLAGLPNRPSYYDPYEHRDEATKQRNIVLGRMLEENYVTQQQYDDASAEPIRLAARHAPKLGSEVYHAPYFVEYVYEELRKRYPEAYLKSGNLKVYTTLNWEMQQVAEDDVQKQIAAAGPGGPTDACLVAIDPATGEIKAMVGGIDYAHSQFNIAADGRRQPGSLFKAILYTAAIDSGLVTEDTTVPDTPISFPMADGTEWTPKDDTYYSFRSVTLKTALAQSINVPAVRVMNRIKPETVIQYAKMMGITSDLDPVLSLALGSSAVTPLEMTDAYATFADNGVHLDPMAFTDIEDDNGNVIDKIEPAPYKVFGPDTSNQINDMLRAVVTEGTGAGADVVPDAHGKTGTTQDHRDVWFIGYTPRLVCGIWAGRPLHDPKTGRYSYGEPMRGTAWGATMCVPMWVDFMQRAEPIFVRDEAKQAALTQKPAASTPAAENANATDDDGDDTASDDTAAKPANTPKPAEAAKVKTPTPPKNTNPVVDNGDGTVTVTIDNDTGLLAPPGSPNSSQVSFAAGQEPTQMAPQYVTQKTTAPVASTTPPAAPPSTAPQGDGSGNDDLPGGSEPVTSPPAEKPQPKPEMVKRLINPDDGLLATKWDPETVWKTYVKGTEPQQYSSEYPPPPGEH